MLSVRSVTIIIMFFCWQELDSLESQSIIIGLQARLLQRARYVVSFALLFGHLNMVSFFQMQPTASVTQPQDTMTTCISHVIPL